MHVSEFAWMSALMAVAVGTYLWAVNTLADVLLSATDTMLM